jgi:ABC-type polysaccharide/polyol phosphate export permease
MRKQYFTQFVQSPAVIIKNLYTYKHVIRQMIKSDIKGRFAGSIGGLLWNFIHPIIMLVVYLFVFVYVFKLRVGEGALMSAMYIMAGLFTWIIMAEGLASGTVCLIQNANLIKRTAFPVEILPTKSVLTPFFSIGIALLVLSLYQVISHGFFSILYLLPVLLIIQICFTLALAFITSTISVYFRDMVHLVQILISFWIFLTPILYPVTMLPDWAKKVMYINPIYPLISLYQSVLLTGKIGPWLMPLLLMAWTLGFFLVGAFVFNKLKFEFADWL